MISDLVLESENSKALQSYVLGKVYESARARMYRAYWKNIIGDKSSI